MKHYVLKFAISDKGSIRVDVVHIKDVLYYHYRIRYDHLSGVRVPRAGRPDGGNRVNIGWCVSGNSQHDH